MMFETISLKGLAGGKMTVLKSSFLDIAENGLEYENDVTPRYPLNRFFWLCHEISERYERLLEFDVRFMTPCDMICNVIDDYKWIHVQSVAFKTREEIIGQFVFMGKTPVSEIPGAVLIEVSDAPESWGYEMLQRFPGNKHTPRSLLIEFAALVTTWNREIAEAFQLSGTHVYAARLRDELKTPAEHEC